MQKCDIIDRWTFTNKSDTCKQGTIYSMCPLLAARHHVFYMCPTHCWDTLGILKRILLSNIHLPYNARLLHAFGAVLKLVIQYNFFIF